jgi:CHAD domain-containing protein
VPELPRAASDLPETPFRRALSQVAATQAIAPVVEIVTRRREIAVQDVREKTVARVVLERATARDPAADDGRRRLPVTLRIVPVRGYETDARRVARFLEEQGARSARGSRFGAALAAVGRDPVALRSHAALDPQDPASRASRRVLGALLDTVRATEQGVRRDVDPEMLHDFRVALRRARSLLGQLEGVLPRREVRRLSKKLRWLVRATNALRDLDVYLSHLPDYRAMLPEVERAGLESMDAFLRRRRQLELRVLFGVLDSERYRSVLDRWESIVRGDRRGASAGGDGVRAIREVAAERVVAAWRRVLERGRAIEVGSPAEALHRLRIDCKKLRYLLESFADVFDLDALAKPVKALKRLQDNLGRFNDLHFQQVTLRRLAIDLLEEHARSAESNRALDTLVSLLADEQRTERAKFEPCFAQLDAPAVRRQMADAIGVAEEALA